MNICIVGASRGLGAALSYIAAERGNMVWGIARNEVGLMAIEKTLPAGKFFWTQTDIVDFDSVSAWKSEMEKRNFSPDTVFLNASVLSDDLNSGGYDVKTGQNTISVNLTGSLNCIAAMLPEMLERGKGKFVAIASTSMLRPSVRSATYTASKAGLSAAMRSFRLAYGDRGIDFKTVCLGPIATEMWEGKRNWLVPSAEKAAEAIFDFSKTKRSIFYYPYISTTLLRLSLWLPDSVFAKVSQKIMK